MNRIRTTLFVILCIATQRMQADNVFMVGHSLINFDIPSMLSSLATNANISHSNAAQIGVGANLLTNWNNPASATGTAYNTALPAGTYDVLVMTEAIPLLNHTTWSNTDQYMTNFHNYAKNYNANTQVYLFETWHCTGSGTPAGCEWDNNDGTPWRTRLDSDLSIWEGLVNTFNNANSGNMLIIPGGQALAMLHDSINEGMSPGLTAITDIFTDNIHLTDIGNYYMACVYFATIYGQSPEGLIHNIAGYQAPSPELAAHLQRLAWRTVTTYPMSGVSSVMPVTLVDFSAEVVENEVLLSWETASEINNEKFLVQESRNGVDFKTIGEVKGQGDTRSRRAYSFVTKNLEGGIRYYRLKQVDHDGRYEYSDVIQIRDITEKEELGLIYPNPIQSGTAYVDLTASTRMDITVSVFNLMGELVLRQARQVSLGYNKLEIDVSQLDAGVYVLSMSGLSGITNQKLMRK